jgi:hypothetical protein
LGILLSEAATAKAPTEPIIRKLKELQVFSGPGVMALLVWEDLEANLGLLAVGPEQEAKPGDKEGARKPAEPKPGDKPLPQRLVGELTDASAVGLHGLLLSKEAWSQNTWVVKPRVDFRGRPIRFKVVLLDWSGKTFTSKVTEGSLKPGDKDAKL